MNDPRFTFDSVRPFCQWDLVDGRFVMFVTLVTSDGKDVRLAFDDFALDVLAALRQSAQRALLDKLGKKDRFSGSSSTMGGAF